MMSITEGVPLPVFPNNVPQNAAMRAHKTRYEVATFGAAAENVNVLGRTVLRRGGADEKAAAVGSSGVREGVAVFTFKIERTRCNDGLGVFLGVADASVDFQNRTQWGTAYAIGCHGQNLFSWKDALGVASLERGGLPGSEESIEDGSVVRVRVDMHKRELAFSVNSGEYQVAKGVVLPAIVRPFVKLAGFNGDKVAMAYEGDEAEIVTDGVPLPVFPYGVPQSSAMLQHGVHYRARILGAHGANVSVSGATAIRNGGKDTTAAIVGARGFHSGSHTFSFRIDRTKGNDGLGLFVGVADSSTDFLNNETWGAAWALGCHGANLFSWEDSFASAQLERGVMPGSEQSLKDGTVIAVRVNMSARPRELAFSIDGGDFVVAKGIALPETVRPFCKLAGADGDAISLAYEGERLPPVASMDAIDERCAAQIIKDNEIIAKVTAGNNKLPRESGDSVLIPEVA